MDRPWPPRPDEPGTHGSGAGGGGPLPAAAALIVGALAVGLAVETALSGPPGITIAIVAGRLSSSVSVGLAGRRGRASWRPWWWRRRARADASGARTLEAGGPATGCLVDLDA